MKLLFFGTGSTALSKVSVGCVFIVFHCLIVGKKWDAVNEKFSYGNIDIEILWVSDFITTFVTMITLLLTYLIIDSFPRSQVMYFLNDSIRVKIRVMTQIQISIRAEIKFWWAYFRSFFFVHFLSGQYTVKFTPHFICYKWTDKYFMPKK